MPTPIAFMKNSNSSVTNSNNKTSLEHLSNRAQKGQKASKRIHNGGYMRKRHWALCSLLVLAGSWITHTTTATIDRSQDGFQQQSQTIMPFIATTTDTTTDAPADTTTIDLMSNELAIDAFSSNDQTARDERLENQTISLASIVPSESALTLNTPIKAASLNSRPHKIQRGESLGIILRKQGLDPAVPHHISKHPVAKQLVSIRVGKTLDFRFDQNDALQQIRYPVNALQELIVNLDGNIVGDAKILDLEFSTKQRSVSAEITSSLYLAAQDAGLSNKLIMEMVRIFGWDIDFVQDVRVGDNFHIVFDEYHKDGEKLSDGDVLAAEFTTQGNTYRAIRFEDEHGDASYFNSEGESMLGTFLRSPVEFSRISSRFGRRKHPISKKWKAHKGVDYAASRGTPIRATADGKVIHAGRKGGYGKTVVLRHAGRFSTLYAHMNGYAKGVKSGARVKQGQTIGYVGSTGMSTGPHLHYEFRVDGVHRNSLTYKTPKASSVAEKDRPAFNQLVGLMAKKLDSVKRNYELAKKGSGNTTKAI